MRYIKYKIGWILLWQMVYPFLYGCFQQCILSGCKKQHLGTIIRHIFDWLSGDRNTIVNCEWNIVWKIKWIEFLLFKMENSLEIMILYTLFRYFLSRSKGVLHVRITYAVHILMYFLNLPFWKKVKTHVWSNHDPLMLPF